MSLVAVVNLAQRLLNQTFEQGQDATGATKQAKNTQGNAVNPSFEDQFTSSALTGAAAGQEAGLFNVQRFAIFSAAADFLLSQPIQAAAAPAEPPVPLKATPNDSAAPAAAEHQTAPVAQAPAATLPVINANPQPPDAPADNTKAQATSLNSTNQIPAPAPTEEVQAPQSVPQAASTAAQPNPQSQLQSLNSALANLGLSAADISIIDRIASLIRDFNPTAFTSLVYQLEGLAKPNTPAAPAATTNTAAAAPSTLTTQANANNFQIQELVVRFSAVNETLQSGNPKTGGTTVNFSAFNLQVEGISLTFTNGAGKTVQVEAPQNTANAANTQAAGNTQARTANA